MGIDIFLTWVDGSDEQWVAEKNKFQTELQKKENGLERYRSWDNLQYVFRGIEKNMPWVDKIFFVTCGQTPKFLNVNHPKLRLINHRDYIPAEYLPTFNSRTIEMNLFRIEELSENFISYNDDLFMLNYIDERYFFKDNMVCDEAIERIIGKTDSLNYAHCLINNAWIINRHFNKRKVRKENFAKWYCPDYGVKSLYRNWLMNYFHDFTALRNPHEPFAMKKSTLKKIWEAEPEMLDTASKNKFRNITDVNVYLIRAWQIFEGEFSPRRHKGKAYTVNDTNFHSIACEIKRKKYSLISIDERYGESLHNFEEARNEINAALQEIFPQKSSFEI